MSKNMDCKKIDIMGIRIDNYSVRESLLCLDAFFGGTVLSIIETVTVEGLILSRENSTVRACMQQADLCIVGEGEILTETGKATAQRLREVREGDFLHEMIKRMTRNRKRVFLLAMTDGALERMQNVFAEWVPDFEAVGSCAAEHFEEDPDAIVNEINGTTPDLVISALDSPIEEEFIQSHKDKIGTSVWYGVRNSYEKERGGVGGVIKKLALKGRLHHMVSKYGQNME